MDIADYAADLTARIKTSTGKRLAESGAAVDVGVGATGLALTYVDAAGRVLGLTTIPVQTTDAAEFAARAEAAVSLLFPEVPRPAPKAILVAVEEPLHLGGGDPPAEEATPEPGSEMPKFLRRK